LVAKRHLDIQMKTENEKASGGGQEGGKKVSSKLKDNRVPGRKKEIREE